MNMKKGLLTVLCVAAIVVSTVFGTLAYLTDDEAVVNTFTVGKVYLDLDEKDVDFSTADAERDKANKYHLLPGQTYEKDPTVTVLADSENCYVRMIVTVQNYGKLKSAIPGAEYYDADGNFLLQKLTLDKQGKQTWNPDNWKCVKIDNGVYEFRYKEVVAKSAADTVLPALFTHITVPGEVDNAQLAYLKDVVIDVKAHAIQEAGFEDDDAAWAAFPTTAGN